MRFNTDSDLSDHEKDSFSKGNNIIITTPKASGQKIKEKRQLLIIKQLAFIVLEAGLEPAQPQWPRDFKSLVSTDSTIRAAFQKKSGKRDSNSRP